MNFESDLNDQPHFFHTWQAFMEQQQNEMHQEVQRILLSKDTVIENLNGKLGEVHELLRGKQKECSNLELIKDELEDKTSTIFSKNDALIKDKLYRVSQ